MFSLKICKLNSNYYLSYACKGGKYFFKGGSISALNFEFAEIGPVGTILQGGEPISA